MAINSAAAALAAYAKAAKPLEGAGGATAHADATNAGPRFADLVQDAIGSATKTGQVAETQAVGGLTKGGEITDIVSAITAAELTLETVVAVRDKVIAAYQDIMKMPI